ncbi:rRNA methyltransferase [Tenacibaculum holothuriorum]|uniref:rRNA methyltransferase n=1 Tax=Tenacibaculum holothuriorum TaxID=1635173 RepID=A0A1Y2PCT8_9FLAO|nr:TrmH family RNA methyltransferase [Tenacibaculum holothuriorum]OSY88245.1 rRNA methyltransferase [Tenacibaculum holothuriorum]
MKQLTHYEIDNSQKKFPITIVCDTIRTPENIGMAFRVAESFGVSKIYLHESSPSTENRTVKRTARNTINQIEFENYSDFNSLISELKKEGNTIIGIEVTDKSTHIQNYDFSKNEKLVLLLGSERNGIEHINLVDDTVEIPMYGRNSSMNVIHSLSITLYEVTNQLNIKNTIANEVK